MSSVALEVRDLRTSFFSEAGEVKAVDGVSFRLEKGKALGVVGESGSGKSVMALSIARLVDRPGRIVGGEVLLEGENLLQLSNRRMRDIRGSRIAMIFQEPMTALNPVLRVGAQIAEAALAHERVGRREAWDRAVEAMRSVAIPDPERRARDYPHQLSGGMRQRVMIAMALAMKPSVLIADEPTTALDVTIQAGILELLDDLRRRYNLALIFISHDLGVIAEVADDVMVMYAGKIVEYGSVNDVFQAPRHPYTQALIRSVPRLGRSALGAKRLDTIEGMTPDLLRLPRGCAFAPRCAGRTGECEVSPVPMKSIGASHHARCVHV
jgi:oligopeptide/dipeptide ABC transporter ATP-binding protein